MQTNPYLLFNGQCKEAFQLYERVLGGKVVTMLTHAESPMAEKTDPGWRDKILHATMMVGATVLMASDAPPGYYERPAGFSVSLSLKEPAEAQRIFKALSEGGTVKMPLQKTFWAEAFAMLVDRFGTPWMINCEQPH
jgi:PhnB protein